MAYRADIDMSDGLRDSTDSGHGVQGRYEGGLARAASVPDPDIFHYARRIMAGLQWLSRAIFHNACYARFQCQGYQALSRLGVTVCRSGDSWAGHGQDRTAREGVGAPSASRERAQYPSFLPRRYIRPFLCLWGPAEIIGVN